MTQKIAILLIVALASCYASMIKEENLKANLKLVEDELHEIGDELTKYSRQPPPHQDERSTSNDPNNDSSYRYTCGFETDCGDDFEIQDTTPLKWEKKLMTRSPQDRTEPYGHYMYASITKENTKDQYAYFTHEFTVRQPEQCGEFYYHMYNRDGCDVARLLVTLECGGSGKTEILMRETGNRENRWHLASLNIKKPVGSKCKLTWRVSKGLTDSGNVYVDEISMYYSPCRRDDEPVRPSQADCSFAEASCQWKQSGPLKWYTGVGGTRTSNTGPNRYFGSYSPGTSGRYYYLEADDPNAKLQSSSIISPKMKTPIDQCMRFMYNMYGADMGSLEAVRNMDGNIKTVFNETGDQGNKWYEGWIDLPANKEIQVELKGTVGNGSKSDIAIGQIKVQTGACDERETFGKCPGENCVITDDVCGAEIKEFKHLEEFQVERSNLLTTIPKISKEWELSFRVKIIDVVRSWTSLIHFTITGNNCCVKGDRIPAIFLHPSSTTMHITNAIEGNGNWAYNDGSLQKNIFSTVKLEQKKDGTGDHIYKIFVNGALKKQQRNRYPSEYRNVKVFAGDDMYNPSNAKIKDLVFKNLGQFDECKPICNKKLSDAVFTNLSPDPPKTYAPAFSPVKNSLKDTIPIIAKEWSLSLEIKPTGTVSSWANILHFTATGNNCCSREGDRIPAIWFRGGSTILHICNSIEWNGNRCVDSPSLTLNQFTKVVVQQRKAGPKYRYLVTVGNKVVLNITNSMPREYNNVKFYAGDPWSTAAKCEIKDIEFKNLVAVSVPVYPCPNMCKGKEVDATIDGNAVKSVSYQQEQCNNRAYVYQVKVPNNIRTPRYSCLQFFYKLGPPKRTSLYCRFEVYYQVYRLVTLTTYEQGKWKKISINVQQYIPFGTKNSLIGVRYYIHDRCSDISFAKLEFRDGIC